MRSRFSIGPSYLIDPALLSRGLITLTAQKSSATPGMGVITLSGGVVSTPDGGLQLTIPPGAAVLDHSCSYPRNYSI